MQTPPALATDALAARTAHAGDGPGSSPHSRDVGPESCNALWSQTNARAGREEEKEMHFAMGQTTPPPKAAVAEFHPLAPGVEVGGELAVGRRPTPLVEVRLQERVQRHTVDHIVDVSTFVQILGVTVPHKGNQLVEFMKNLDATTPEEFIVVPKISQDRIQQRFVERRRPQRAEQLEVPTVVSYSSLQQSAEQNVDMPVPGTRGDHGGFQGFLTRQSSLQRAVEQVVDIPVGGGPQDFLRSGFLSVSLSSG